MNLIEAKRITKQYKNNYMSTDVLKGIDLTVSTGEFVSIVGPSGCGKTTLLYVLSTLEPITNGSLKLFGKDISGYNRQEIANLRANDIGFVFQFFNLIPNLTVYENLLLVKKIGSKKDTLDIEQVLEIVGMIDYQKHYPNQLSGGMQQRIAIARSLINKPAIVFADEPIGNLDYQNGITIMELFASLNKEYQMTIVMVTHNEETTKYGTRTIHMLDGKVIRDEKINR